MKLRILLGVLASTFIFFACNDDEVSDNFLPSAQISPSVNEVTIFDAPFTCDFSVSNSDVTGFTITGGASEKTVTVSDLAGSTEFTEADFGADWEIDGELDYTTTIDFGSNVATQSFSIVVIDALSASSEGTASEYDSTKVFVALTGETMFKNLGQVVISRKVITEADPEPDYVVIESGSASTEYEYTDSIVGVDYNANDTIVYQITAIAGSNTETKTVEIPVGVKAIPSPMEGALATSEDTFAFLADEEGDNDYGTLTFTSSDTQRGFISSDVMLVPMTTAAENFSDLVDFIDNSTMTATINNVTIGDMFAFKYSDDTYEYYGVLKVTSVESIAIGDPENAIAFTYTFDKKE